MCVHLRHAKWLAGRQLAAGSLRACAWRDEVFGIIYATLYVVCVCVCVAAVTASKVYGFSGRWRKRNAFNASAALEVFLVLPRRYCHSTTHQARSLYIYTYIYSSTRHFSSFFSVMCMVLASSAYACQRFPEVPLARFFNAWPWQDCASITKTTIAVALINMHLIAFV